MGDRDYDDCSPKVMEFIERAQSLGFTLRDIADYLRSPTDGGRKARLNARLEAKTVELDAHM